MKTPIRFYHKRKPVAMTGIYFETTENVGGGAYVGYRDGEHISTGNGESFTMDEIAAYCYVSALTRLAKASKKKGKI